MAIYHDINRQVKAMAGVNNKSHGPKVGERLEALFYPSTIGNFNNA